MKEKQKLTRRIILRKFGHQNERKDVKNSSEMRVNKLIRAILNNQNFNSHNDYQTLGVIRN